MTRSILIIADPISTFNPVAETTSFIAHELVRQKWQVWMTTLPQLMLGDKKFEAQAMRVSIAQKNKKFVYKILKTKVVSLHTFNVVFLRKDPPVDEMFTQHLIMLHQFEVSQKRKRTFFINSPLGVLESNEKIFPLMIPGLSAPTLITSSLSAFRAFLKKHRYIVIKPLNLSGGRGIVRVKISQKNADAIFKKSSHNFSCYMMLQKFIPAALNGDKRILVFNGKILGSFLRVPAKGDFRGNLHSGASLKACPSTVADQKLVKKLAPHLKARGLYFVGIDLLGRFVTEINSTSPMGINEVNQLDNSHIEKKIVNWISGKLI
ncbi:glutathione synthase [bacterium]|nr:glutathione synthase [bacterium]